MSNRPFPLTRRDRFRLLQAEAAKKPKDENKNDACHEDVTDSLPRGFNGSAANGASWEQTNGQDAAHGTGPQDLQLVFHSLNKTQQRFDQVDNRGPHEDQVDNNGPHEDQVDNSERHEDGVDIAPTRLNDAEASLPGVLDIFTGLLGLGFFVYDVFTDVRLAVMYFQEGHMWWFGLTAMFVVMPAAVMTAFNLCFYMMDMFVVRDHVSAFRWLLRVTFSMLMLGPLIRIFETLDYALRSLCSCGNEDRQRVYANKYVDAEVDSALIGLIEAFLEAGPQLILQLCVFESIGWTTDTTTLVTYQLTAIASSLCALAWALVRFRRAVLASRRPTPAGLSLCRSLIDFLRGTVALCLWRLFTISARVLVLATFASCFTWWLFIVITAHYFFMLIWICKQPTQFFFHRDSDGKIKHDKYLEAVFKGFAAFIYVFDFLNLVSGHIRLRAVLFYSIVYMENCVLIGVWYFFGYCSSMGEIGVFIVLGVVLGGFWIGIAFMGIHYMCCHPDRENVKCCVPNAKLFLCKDPHEGETEVDCQCPML